MAYVTQPKRGTERNRLYEEDRPVHEWYRFVLSYPPHLVRHYLDEFALLQDALVLDPFCGTGTTLVECKKRGLQSVGIEANPVVHFAASTKVNWSVDPVRLEHHAKRIADQARARLDEDGVPDEAMFMPLDAAPTDLLHLSPAEAKLLIKGSISKKPLHKALVLRGVMEEHADARCTPHERLALAKHLVFSSSNLRFGPEVGVGKRKPDAAVVSPWLAGVQSMADDLRGLQALGQARSTVLLGDARTHLPALEPESIDAVITSPPYPNEKDYSRTTRLESVLLGFMNDRKDLRAHKEGLLCSNTRTVYKALTEDAKAAERFPRVSALADRIDARRVELKKTSGFEKLYGEVVRRYFGGMARHLEQLTPYLKPGARLAYVVGDQASYFQIMIRTGEILAEIAARLGYEVERIDLFRTRAATATRAQLREEVVVLRWPE
jgi:hypothetical protein